LGQYRKPAEFRARQADGSGDEDLADVPRASGLQSPE
jgi:hypothetical protein